MPEGLRTIDQTPAHLVAITLAGEATSAVGPRRFLHAGPPLTIDEMPGPMRAAAMGALILEGEAANLDEAASILDAGDIDLASCNEHGAVGAAAGIISPKIPVVVAATPTGRRAFAPLHEGNGATLRYGAYGPETIARLEWLGSTFTPALNQAIQHTDQIDLTALQAEGLRRGDECHNRNAATSTALVLALAPALVRLLGADAAELIADVADNNQFFLSFSMAAAKAIADEAHADGEAGMVTGIAANGRRVGIRVSGCDKSWFVAEAPLGTPRVFDGYTLDDACHLMGDSFATEVIGLGAMASSAAPALASFLGADPADASTKVAEMRTICSGTSSRFLLPFEGYRGTPIGISVHNVAATKTAPLVNGGFAHREPGVGMVGAGVVRLPLDPFLDAHAALTRPAQTAPAT